MTGNLQHGLRYLCVISAGVYSGYVGVRDGGCGTVDGGRCVGDCKDAGDDGCVDDSSDDCDGYGGALVTVKVVVIVCTLCFIYLGSYCFCSCVSVILNSPITSFCQLMLKKEVLRHQHSLCTLSEIRTIQGTREAPPDV